MSGLTFENAIPILPRTLSDESPGTFQATRPANDTLFPLLSIDPSTGVPGIRTRIDSVQKPPADTSRVKDTAFPSITLKRRRCRSSLRTLRMVPLDATRRRRSNQFLACAACRVFALHTASRRRVQPPGDECHIWKGAELFRKN